MTEPLCKENKQLHHWIIIRIGADGYIQKKMCTVCDVVATRVPVVKGKKGKKKGGYEYSK